MTDHQPDLCPACHHPKAHHTAGSLCTGWHGVNHSCPAYTDEHIERRDADTAARLSEPTRGEGKGHELGPIIIDETAGWPGWAEDLNPRELGESPNDYQRRIEQLGTIEFRTGPDGEPVDETLRPGDQVFTYLHPDPDNAKPGDTVDVIPMIVTTVRPANQPEPLDPDELIDVGDDTRAQAARVMRTPLDPAAFGLDPDDQATHPARNPHDLTVAASTLRGAAQLARQIDDAAVIPHVAEWLEQLAQQFDTERENLT